MKPKLIRITILVLLLFNLLIAQKIVLPKQSRPRALQEDLSRSRRILPSRRLCCQQEVQLMSSQQFQAFQRGNHFTITPTAKTQQGAQCPCRAGNS